MLHKLGVPSTIWFYFKHISNIAFFSVNYSCINDCMFWILTHYYLIVENMAWHGVVPSSAMHALGMSVAWMVFFPFLWPIISESIYFVLKRHPPNPISLLSLWCMLTHIARIFLKATKQYKGEQHHESFLTASSKCNLLCTMLTD